MELKSMSDGKAAAVAEGSKVRPCEACGVRQARWFCAADDASLCHPCDTSVHSANSVACRHERVKISIGLSNLLDSQSSWLKKRSRSDRFYNSKQRALKLTSNCQERQCSLSGPEFPDSIESDMDLGFELESLIGGGSHDEQEDQLRGLGLGLCEDADTENLPSLEWLFDRVKMEVEEEGEVEGELKVEGPDEGFDLNVEGPDEGSFDLNVDLSDLMEVEEVKVNKLDVDNVCLSNNEEKKICLKLNYEDVLSAWCGRGSPWADQNQNAFYSFLDDSGSEAAAGLEYGVVPDLNAGSGAWVRSTEDVPVTQCKPSGGFREARVMRYREKRRSRLFSKRIRYQVRKLNAEQRPRMKGRFVKKDPELFSAHKHRR